jgi:hypothetical protein
MRPLPFDPRTVAGNTLAQMARWVPRIGPAVSGSIRALLRWGAHHTGLPVVLVAAITLVLSWRILKRTLRLVVEVAIALALLVVATRMGWLTW